MNKWPRAKLSDAGFEDEQKFSNLMLLDAYVYGSFAVGDSDLQLRLGNQVVNWGESLFIQGVNQINPIDVPAARRSGAEIKEILLPAWLAYANWGLSFGSVEAFYQFEWNNTSIDSCGTYWGVTNGIISANPGQCKSATPITPVVGSPVAGTSSPTVPQFGSNPWSQYNGLYVPLGKGKEAPNSGQFGLAFRFPVEKIDTEIGLYGMNIHSRLPVASGYAGTSITSLNATQRAALTQAGLIGTDAVGPYWALGTTRLRGPSPFHAAYAKQVGAAIGQPINITPGTSYWEYPEDIQIFGVSTASNIAGWSVSSELSYQKDVPVQVNGNDLLNSLLALVGPNAEEGLETYLKNAGQSGKGAGISGYDQFDVTQFQVNGEPAGDRRGRCAVEQRARLHDGRGALRPRLHVGPRLEPGLRDRRDGALAGFDLLADVPRRAGAGPGGLALQPVASRLQERRLRDGLRLGLPPARVDGLQQRHELGPTCR